MFKVESEEILDIEKQAAIINIILLMKQNRIKFDEIINEMQKDPDCNHYYFNITFKY